LAQGLKLSCAKCGTHAGSLFPAMGNVYSYPKDVPPGGALLYVQEGGGCCPAPVSFHHSKPGMLPLSDSAWDTFKSKVQEAGRSMVDEKYCLIPLVLFIPVALLFGFVLRSVAEDLPLVGQFMGLPLVLMGVGGHFAAKHWILTQNQQKDRIIAEACADLATSTSGQVAVQYRTQFVGFCRPKHAQPFRAIALSPVGGSMIGASPGNVGQVMQVQIPQGVGPGQTMQVQGPSGETIQVQVPPGTGPGQVIQVQLPAPQPVMVQATVVEGSL